MEWTVVIIIVWVIWRLLTAKARRAYVIQDAINRAYMAKKNDMNDWIDTPIYWEVAVKYARERGINSYDTSIYIDTTINGKEVTATLMRSNNGTTMVKLW